MKRIVIFVALAFVVAYFVELAFFPGHKGNVAPRTADRSDACFISQKFVKQNLKAPSTAEFPMWTEENCKATPNGDVWKVRSYVDAQNGFGAMIRSDYGVEMRYHPDADNWTLLDILIVSP